MIDFSTIIVQTRCSIKLAYGGQSFFSIDESGEKANWVNVSIVNNQLIIYSNPEYYGYLLLHDYYPQITITCKTLTELQMLDKCFVESVETLKVQKLGIIAKEGRLDIAVDAFSIDCAVLKNAYVKLSGETIISYVLTHQRSVYDGSELEASEGKVHAHDDSTASVWYTEEMELGLYMRSKVNYQGSPRMKISQIAEGCALKQN